ncbi:hypothetical protein HELRODRAFT_158921 [Helobdella robusta]|uniref:Sperm microtubule inner protein 1 C-terminal domain-containing protein n=1 Tax=Helobdella robusta TaxID=6412 RepID=T1ENE5_HELRO|nr:hypothetical protein HELRODRAFT_158921 [Helobdella robusta]ESO12400.1 hypothetical protein HELRODRAFT_158921 [Helobdella robusta]
MAEIKNYKKLKMEARKKFCPALTKEMFEVEPTDRKVLSEYMPDSDHGFTKRYIERRILQPPLKRYTYCLLTSMSYGASDCYDPNFCGPIFGKRNCYKRSKFTDNHFPDINLGGKLHNDNWK